MNSDDLMHESMPRPSSGNDRLAANILPNPWGEGPGTAAPDETSNPKIPSSLPNPFQPSTPTQMSTSSSYKLPDNKMKVDQWKTPTVTDMGARGPGNYPKGGRVGKVGGGPRMPGLNDRQILD